jgi:hypothetical protein
MSWRFEVGGPGSRLRLSSWDDEPSSDLDRDQAELLLRESAGDVFALQRLRRLMRDELGGISPLGDDRLIAEVARRVAGGEIHIGVVHDELPAPGAPLEPRPPAPSTRAEPSSSWIKIAVVDAATDDPVRGVRLWLKKTNSAVAEPSTDDDGLIEVRGMPGGTCEARCDLKDATIDDTLAVTSDAALGEAPGEGALHVALIEDHRVQTGETLRKLAAGAGMSEADLAYFNWRTRDPEQIQRHLCNDVGCTRVDAAGAMVFDASDEPGRIYLPRRWEKRALATERTHVIQARRLARPSLTGHAWVRFVSRHDYPLGRVPCALRGGGESWPAAVTSDAGEVSWSELPLDEDYAIALELGGRSLEIRAPWMRERFAAHCERVVDAEALLGPADDGWGVQVRLLGLGYDPGAVDGVVGPKTRAALASFLDDRGVRHGDRFGRELLEILADAFGG